MKSQFAQKYKMLLIFIGLSLLVVAGDRIFNHGPQNNVEQAASVQDPVLIKDTGTDAVVATVKVEDDSSVDVGNFDLSALKVLELKVVAQAIEASKTQLIQQQVAGAAFTSESRTGEDRAGALEVVAGPSSSKFISFSDFELGVVAGSVIAKISGLASEPAFFLRAYGVINDKLVAVSCVRPSGKPLSILTGDCATKISEVFAIELH